MKRNDYKLKRNKNEINYELLIKYLKPVKNGTNSDLVLSFPKWLAITPKLFTELILFFESSLFNSSTNISIGSFLLEAVLLSFFTGLILILNLILFFKEND